MKKSLFALTVALSFGLAAAQTAPVSAPQVPALTDVPAGHWAKDAIDRLVSRGIILGYPDGTFRGTQNITRYEAAIIIARLLDQVREGETPVALNQEDITALQNAIQELAADLAALGVRVSDIEANAVSRDDFTRLEARIEEVAAAAANTPAPAGDATALQGLQTQIDELTVRVDEYDALRADVDDSASNIAALNDLTVLLNQDILDLQDRLSAVEGAQADFVQRSDFDTLSATLSGQVAAVDARVTATNTRVDALENGRVSLTAGISTGYGRIGLVRGNQNFDVDRVTNGTFAATEFTDDTGRTPITYYGDTTRRPTPTVGITFGVKATNIKAPGNIVVEDAGINFGFLPTRGLVSDLDPTKTYSRAVVTLDSLEALGSVGDSTRFRVIAKPYGEVPLRPDAVNTRDKLVDVPGYNAYLLPNGALNGVSAAVSLADVPFKPTLYLTGGLGRNVNGDYTDNLLGGYYGARLEAKLGNRGVAGLTFFNKDAEGNSIARTAFSADATYAYTVRENDTDRRVFGVKGVYVASVRDLYGQTARGVSFTNAFENRDQAAVIEADTNIAGVNVSANFRAVSPGFAGGVAGMDINGDNPKYSYTANPLTGADGAVGQVGYGLDLSTNIAPLTIGAYADRWTNYYDRTWQNERLAAGAQVGAGFGGFRVTALARYAAFQKKPVRYVFNPAAVGSSSNFVSVSRTDIVKPGKADNLFKYTSSVGAALIHDGTAKDALVKDLNLTLAGAYFYPQDRPATMLIGLAEYNAKTPYVTLKPFFGAVYFAPTNTAAAAADYVNYTTLKYGLGAETPKLGGRFQPQLKASVLQTNFARGAYSTVANNVTTPVAAATATETTASAEVILNNFFSANSKLSLGYGFQRGANMASDKDIVSKASASTGAFGFGGSIYNPTTVAFGGAYTQTQGLFGQLSYNDALRLNYGVFLFDADTRSSADTVNVAQGFKVTYGFKF